jgi:preprotein translocase subunit SecY
LNSSLLNIFRIPELRKKLWITISLLLVYRIGFHIPIPGVIYDNLAQQTGGDSMVFGIMNALSGGAIGSCMIFALGVMPYISSSIIFSLLVKVVPALEALQKEGATGVKKINQYTRWATVPICIVQSLFVIYGMLLPQARVQHLIDPDLIGGGFTTFIYVVGLIVTFTAGTLFIMWVGEKITENGVGNGISLIIMAGIVADLPAQYQMLSGALEPSERWQTLVQFGVLYFAIVLGIVFVTKAQRRIPVTHAKHVKGRRVYGQQKSYLPLRVNQANVMPIIFASALWVAPAVIAKIPGMGWVDQTLRWGGFWWVVGYSALIFFFSYFWTALVFQPNELANNLKEYGGFVPGLRPGKRTADELERIMIRITLVGATFLCLISLMPNLVSSQIPNLPPPLTIFLGGTSMLIVVGVALDLVDKVNSYVVMRNYEGFMTSGSAASWARGRRR